MSDELQRFIKAQEQDYAIALAEIQSGRKRGHWMWYIFPQLAGLGSSPTSKFYAIADMNEANAYLLHEQLGQRLIEITTALLGLSTNDANEVFGSPDNMKLRSSMTLFSLIPNAPPVFQAVLDKFFSGNHDDRTKKLLIGQ
ncbi:MAG: DUF1810 domain-containing protein [Planctomycetaceae bacterium]|nr:DUF1810 domain-containing protein [Planctomycetaceae bacterium]